MTLNKSLTSLDTSNLLETKVAEFRKHQPHGGLNELLSVKSTKIEKEKGVSHMMLL